MTMTRTSLMHTKRAGKAFSTTHIPGTDYFIVVPPRHYDEWSGFSRGHLSWGRLMVEWDVHRAGAESAKQDTGTSIDFGIPPDMYNVRDIYILYCVHGLIATRESRRQSGDLCGEIDPADEFLYPTGMTAIYTLSQALASLSEQPVVVTFGWMHLEIVDLARRGFWTKVIPFHETTEGALDSLEALLETGQQVHALSCEFPSSVKLECPNLQRIRSLALKYNLIVACDETMGNFVNVDVMPYVDVAITSLTKIFNGAADVMGGSLVLDPQSRYHESIADEVGRAATEGVLWIGGAGVSSGYVNDPDRNAAAFTTANFGKLVRFHRTGDIVRRLPDGQIDYIGRLGHQVKVRGFRVDLRAVERGLLRTGLFSETAVIHVQEPQGGAGSLLVAYVIPIESSCLPEVSRVKQLLAEILPDYMIPQHFEFVPKFPLNSHGKVDTKCLLQLFRDRSQTPESPTMAPPTSDTRTTLSGLWAHILPTPRGYVYQDTDDFYTPCSINTANTMRIVTVFGTGNQAGAVALSLLANKASDFHVRAVSSLLIKPQEMKYQALKYAQETGHFSTVCGIYAAWYFEQFLDKPTAQG
ncbi:hypothetical protein BDW62DRAFT_201895 [Aspergillus aurantiobrunneus]